MAQLKPRCSLILRELRARCEYQLRVAVKALLAQGAGKSAPDIERKRICIAIQCGYLKLDRDGNVMLNEYDSSGRWKYLDEIPIDSDVWCKIALAADDLLSKAYPS